MKPAAKSQKPSETKAKRQKPKGKNQVGMQIGDSSSKRNVNQRFGLQNAAKSKESCPRLKNAKKKTKQKKERIPSICLTCPVTNPTLSKAILMSIRAQLVILPLIPPSSNLFYIWPRSKKSMFLNLGH